MLWLLQIAGNLIDSEIRLKDLCIQKIEKIFNISIHFAENIEIFKHCSLLLPLFLLIIHSLFIFYKQ